MGSVLLAAVAGYTLDGFTGAAFAALASGCYGLRRDLRAARASRVEAAVCSALSYGAFVLLVLHFVFIPERG